MIQQRKIYKLYGAIKNDIRDVEQYHTGLVGEALIVASYKQMTISQLEKLRFIINKIIGVKKGYEKANEAKDAANQNKG
jgi:hypothetical protein